jgi:hypothetical protein
MTLPEILSASPDTPVKESLSERCASYLRDQGVPHDLIALFDECAYGGPIRIGHLWLSPLADLELENSEEENRPCIEHGFLIVGSGLNGDPVAVELATGTMAFLSHDLLWEREYDDFEECVVRTPLRLHDFWAQAAGNADFPADSYDARRYWSGT